MFNAKNHTPVISINQTFVKCKVKIKGERNLRCLLFTRMFGWQTLYFSPIPKDKILKWKYDN